MLGTLSNPIVFFFKITSPMNIATSYPNVLSLCPMVALLRLWMAPVGAHMEQF